MNCDDHQNSAMRIVNMDVIKPKPGIYPIGSTYMWICNDCGAFLLPDGFSFRAITVNDFQDWAKMLNAQYAARQQQKEPR